MNKLIVTGYNSTIAKSLFVLISKSKREIEIIRCGRCNNADVQFDFSDIEQTRKFCNFIRETSPTHLFVNHGLLVGEKIKNTSVKDISDALQVNLVSFAMILETITEIENLKTVVMSSISGKAGSYDTLYAATKAGVDVLVKSFSTSLPSNSRLNAISPGIIEDAKMTTVRTDLDVLALKKEKTPTQKFSTSLEVAKLTEFILFEASNLQGENINLNGGMYVC